MAYTSRKPERNDSDLPLKERAVEALGMRRQGLTYRQIAKALDISIDAAKRAAFNGERLEKAAPPATSAPGEQGLNLEELQAVAEDLRRYMACRKVIENGESVTVTFDGGQEIALANDEVSWLVQQVQKRVAARLAAKGVVIPGVEG
jgi:transposase